MQKNNNFWLFIAACLLAIAGLFWQENPQDSITEQSNFSNLSQKKDKNKTKKSKEKYIDTTQILGKWRLPTRELYHTLHFINYTDLLIDNHIDTTFRFNYKLRNDTLFLYQFENQRILLYTNILHYLSRDTLIFQNFMEKAEEQAYYKLKP